MTALAKSTLAELVAQHWSLPPAQLMAAVWAVLPGATVDEVAAELRRQADADERHADALRVRMRRRFGD
jgi:hypothetical protein